MWCTAVVFLYCGAVVARVGAYVYGFGLARAFAVRCQGIKWRAGGAFLVKLRRGKAYGVAWCAAEQEKR